MVEGITVKKSDDTAEWYEQVCLKSEVADFGPVKGTIVIRPRGYYIWEQIQKYFQVEILDKFEVDNAYFPFVIPESFFKKEAEHAEGFAPELAWIATANDADLKEKAIIRPTSETLIVDSFKKWLRNYKQLPIKVNQWCNVVRWEVKQTKLFLRGREFLWQEGHCIYQTADECQRDVIGIIESYKKLAEELLALPILMGEKTQAERFAGAAHTYAIETLMPDGKAVQMGTSHNLGQGFMDAFGVKYRGNDEKDHVPYYNSWGVSTRMIGATIMMHSDDAGLVLPPGLVKNKVVIIPASHKNNVEQITKAATDLARELKKYNPLVDERKQSMGWKLGDWEMKGAPLVLILGGQELEKGVVTLKPRDQREKTQVPLAEIVSFVKDGLAQFQDRLFTKAQETIKAQTVQVSAKDEFAKAAKDGLLIKTHFCGIPDCEKHVEDTYGVGSRCISLEQAEKGKCVFCDKPSVGMTFFSRSY